VGEAFLRWTFRSIGLCRDGNNLNLRYEKRMVDSARSSWHSIVLLVHTSKRDSARRGMEREMER